MTLSKDDIGTPLKPSQLSCMKAHIKGKSHPNREAKRQLKRKILSIMAETDDGEWLFTYLLDAHRFLDKKEKKLFSKRILDIMFYTTSWQNIWYNFSSLQKHRMIQYLFARCGIEDQLSILESLKEMGTEEYGPHHPFNKDSTRRMKITDKVINWMRNNEVPSSHFKPATIYAVVDVLAKNRRMPTKADIATAFQEFKETTLAQKKRSKKKRKKPPKYKKQKVSKRR